MSIKRHNNLISLLAWPMCYQTLTGVSCVTLSGGGGGELDALIPI